MNRDPESLLSETSERLALVPDCPYHLVKRALAIQGVDREDGPSLKDARDALERAAALDPHHVEALQEIAHFYDAVMPDRELAVHYARMCLQVVNRIAAEMTALVQTDEA